MATTVKIEDLDVSKLSFSYKPNNKEDKKADFFWMNYGGKQVNIQFPKSSLLFGGASDYQNDGKFSVSIDIAYTPEVVEKFKKIEEMVKEFAKEKLKSLKMSKKQFTHLIKYREIDGEHIDSISVFDSETEKWQNPFLTFKIDFSKSEFVHEKKKIDVTPENIKMWLSRNNEILPVVSYYGYVTATQYGLTNKMMKTKIYGDSNTNKIQFLDTSDVESNSENVVDSDGDSKMVENTHEHIIVSSDEEEIPVQ